MYFMYCTFCKYDIGALTAWEEGYSTLFSLLLCQVFYSFFMYQSQVSHPESPKIGQAPMLYDLL